jgi:hypothetical protein
MCTPRSLWETPEVTTVRAAIRTMAACQLANKPSAPPLSSDRGPGCRTAPAAPTGPAPDAVLVGDAGGHDGSEKQGVSLQISHRPTAIVRPRPGLSHSSSSSHRGHVYTRITVGDAGGHDGSEKQGVSLQISHLTHRYRPTTARAVAQLQQLSQVQLQTRFSWETPEVTTVRAAIRTNAMHESFAAAPNRAVAPSTPTTQFVDSNTGNSSQPPVFACLKTRHGLCNSPVSGL